MTDSVGPPGLPGPPGPPGPGPPPAAGRGGPEGSRDRKQLMEVVLLQEATTCMDFFSTHSDCAKQRTRRLDWRKSSKGQQSHERDASTPKAPENLERLIKPET